MLVSLAVVRPVCSDSFVEAAPGTRPGIVLPEAPLGPAAARRRQLDDLFKEHAPYIARLAYRLLGQPDEVDDVVQDVFISLFRHMDTIRQAESLRAWLATTTVRMVRRRLRTRRFGFFLRWGDQIDPAALKGPSVSGEDRAALWNVHLALESVSVSARIAWVFRYLEQESVEDVARLCGCSRSTAKRRIADAHRVVKRALSDD